MNITEIEVTDRILVSRRLYEKEVATVKGFTPKGTVIIRTCSGHITEVNPEQVIKRF